MMSIVFLEDFVMELVIKNIEKKYNGKVVLNNINIELKTGIYAFLGPNGAGKSTMFRMISTVEKPEKGEIYYQGSDIFQMGENYREKIGYVSQKFGYYPDFTAYKFLQYIAKLKDISDEEIVIKEVLEKVNLWKDRDKKIKTFSGGMKQRLNIAQALLNDPEILLLDEPTVGLDPNERINFKNFILKISENKIVLFATHIVSDVEDIADRVIILHNGKIRLHENMTDLREFAQNGNSVWECSLYDIDKIKEIRDRCTISKMTRIKGGVHFRIISEEKPCEEAIHVNGSLEEIYLKMIDK